MSKNYEEFTLFDMIMPQYKIDPNKKLRLISTFSGYDSQALALKYLGVNFEHYRTCEWAVKSIQALKDLHFSNDNTDYSKEYNLDYIYNYLYNKGISSNYNEPMKLEQIKRLGEDRARTIYNNIQATKNMVNIQQVKAEDLAIVEKDKYEYMLTYSFPCQDLSLAGLRKGMKKGESTRSGMLWEVERILDECKELNALPNILFMENVPEVIGKNNIKDFQKWIEKLESLGYENHVKCLNSKDYGVPQNRNRCFMFSILGEYVYKFPQPFELKLRLKDLLESNVDEKYYLSDKMVKYITADNEKWTGNNGKSLINKKVASTLNTNEGIRRCDASNYICEQLPEEYDLKTDKIIRVGKTKSGGERSEIISTDGICSSLTATDYKQPKQIAVEVTAIVEGGQVIIPEATKKGYAEVHEGDSVNLEQPNSNTRRCRVGKGIANTLLTNCQQGVIIKAGQFRPKDRYYNKKGNKREEQFEMRKDELSNAILTGDRKNCVGEIKKSCYNSTLRIRKLTPKECFRLMGVKDEDFDKIKNNQSDSSLYHLAGDSIVTTLMVYMFKNLF